MPPEPTRPPRTPSAATVQHRTMVVLVITQIVGTVGVGVAPSIGVLMAGQVTHDPAWAGLARTFSTLGAALFGLPLGGLAARFGRRAALTSGWWIAAVGSGLLVLAAQWSQAASMFVGLFLIGAGSAVSLQARFAATDLAEPHHKARALSLIVWVGTIGNVLGPNLGVPAEYLTRSDGLTVFAGAFLIAAVCLAAAGLVVLVGLRPDPLLFLERTAHGARLAPTGGKGGQLRQISIELRDNHRARLSVLAILTAQVVMVAVMTMAPVHVSGEGGSVTIVGLTISLHIAGMYVFSPLVGAFADRRGHRAAIGVGIAILVVALLVGVVEPRGTGWTMVCLVLLGVGWSFVNVSGSALFSTVASPDTRASAQGGVDALSNLLGAAASFAAGPLLAVSSFATLCVVAMVVLVPLSVLVASRRRPVAA